MELTPEEREKIYQEETAKRAQKPTDWRKKNVGWPTLLFLVIVVGIGLSFFHVVWNTPEGIIFFAKDQPGLSDTFVNFDSLTGIPKIVVLAQHSSVIKGLEKKGLIKWDNPFENKDVPVPKLSDFMPKKADLELLDYKASSTEYSRYVIGTILNKSSKTCTFATININLMDKKGDRVGSTSDSITNLGPGEKWKFKALVTNDDTKTFQVGAIEGTLQP